MMDLVEAPAGGIVIGAQALARAAAALEVARGMEPAKIDFVHSFTPGIYAREMRAPRGAILISKVHFTDHPFVLSKGKLAIWTEKNGVVDVCAPYSGVTKAGTIRMAYVLEDCVWTTFHATDKTDVEEIEKDLGTDPRNLLAGNEDLCHSLQPA